MSYLDDLATTIRGYLPAEALPTGDVDALFRLYAVLALAKGEAVTAEDVHNAWAAWMQESNVDHGSLRPFSELDHATQAEDDPYARAIRAAARDLSISPASP
jgi:hypothetical protein